MSELTQKSEVYRGTMTMGGNTFNIDIPAVVATIDDKPYCDLNVAIKTLGTVECVADAAVTEAIAIAENSTLVLKANGYTIGGLDNLTLKGGTFDFDPSAAGCTIATGYEAQDNGDNTWTVVRGHEHQWNFTLNGATLTANCTNMAKPCDVPDRTTAIELTVTGGGDGVAPTFAIANRDTFLGYVNKDGEIVTIADTYTVTRTTEDGAAYDKWYVGNYKVTCVATVNGEAQTLEKAFTIAKPEGGYTSGWEVGNTATSVRYDSWAEALTVAKDGDTIYYRDGERDYNEHEYSVGEKNLTIDFGGATLTKSSAETMTIKNTGTGTLTLQNVTLKQPSGKVLVGQIATSGNIVFGNDVKVKNVAAVSSYYCTVTASGSLIVSNGLYQCGFEKKDSSVLLLEGGKYWENAAPTAVNYVNHLVREIEGDYKYEVIEHTHVFEYTANGLVITCACVGEDATYCPFNLSSLIQTATLSATNAYETGMAYAGAKVTYTAAFPDQAQTIKYFMADGTPLEGAPSTYGDYIARFTVEGATVEKAFTIFSTHEHQWSPLTLDGNVVSSVCAVAGCDVKEVSVSLNIASKVYDGKAVAATVVKSAYFETFFPGVVGEVKYYDAAKNEISAPKYTGSYTAKLGVGGLTIAVPFQIQKPEAGYTDGWEVNNTPTSVRYDTWEEALAAAQDGDTVYYHEDDRDFAEHEFSIGEKNLTLDFGGKTLTRTDSALYGMTIKNTGSGALILQNVVLKQPRGTFSGHISTSGNIVFGEGVKVVNTATDSANYCTITATGSLIVSNGLYQCGFAELSGEVVIVGGKYWQYDDPSEFVAETHVVEEIEGDYKYQVVPHTHDFHYVNDGADKLVLRCKNSAGCLWNLNDNYLTLTATNAYEGAVYAGASYAITGDSFLYDEIGEIEYYQGETKLAGAPTDFGDYTAKVTVRNDDATGTAVAAFTVYHNHVFTFDADNAAGTITARCTRKTDCDFNENPRIVTLTVANGTYSGAAQELASVMKNTEDFPGEVELAYYQGEAALDGAPTDAGEYVAKMSVEGVTVEKAFTIAKASMANASITLAAESFDFSGEECVNSLSSLKLADYTLVEGDYAVAGSSVFSAIGSGYSNETYAVTIAGQGNFEGEQTKTWTIRAPEGKFAADALSIMSLYGYGSYGTVGGNELTVTDSTGLIYIEGSGWFAGVNVKVPYDIKVLSSSDSTAEDPEYLRVRLATMKGTKKGSELPFATSADVVSAVTDEQSYIGKTIKYVKSVSWATKITPAAVEEAVSDGKDALNLGLTVGGLRWDYNTDGLVYTDFTIRVPVATGFTFALTNGATFKLGATTLVYTRMRMGLGAKVVSTVKQDKPCFIPADEAWSIRESVEEGVYTYECTEYVEPSVPEDQGAVIVDETTKTVVVEPEEGVRNIDVENGEGYTVEIPPTVDSVTGVEKEDLKIVADATNEAETVQVDITSAFNIEQLEGGGLGITLDPEAKVEIVIGETCETNAVMPELGTAAGTTVEKSPFVVGGDTVATGVKTIPGLFYNLLAGEDLAGITNLVKTIEAKSTRVVLEAAKASDPTQFYRVEVTK